MKGKVIHWNVTKEKTIYKKETMLIGSTKIATICGNKVEEYLIYIT